MPNRELVKKANEAITNVSQFDVDSLHVDANEALSLADGKSVAAIMKQMMGTFTPEVLSLFDDNALNRVNSHAVQTLNAFRHAASWKVTDGQEKRDAALRGLREQLENNIANLKGEYVFAQLRELDPETLTERIARAQEAMAAAQSEMSRGIEASQSDAKALLERLQEIADNAQRAAGLTSAAANAEFFRTAAGEYEGEAEKWGKRAKGAVKMLICGLLFVILLPFAYHIPYLGWLRYEGTEGAAQLIGIKLVVLGPILYRIVLCARNYMAHKHNGVVNRHRQNALQTFRALVDAAKDPAKQEIILTKAADAIFSHQDSGFIKTSDVSEGPKQVIEMFKKD